VEIKMPDEKHLIKIEERENIYVTGVNEVISFDDETIIADTQLGNLVIRGNDLHISKLNLDTSELEVSGNICELKYDQQDKTSKNKSSSSFWEKIFK
jgi:sporulation protein YabP